MILMISQEYVNFNDLAHQVMEGESSLSFPERYTIKQILKIKKNIPKTYDNIARILALSTPVVELILFNMGYSEDESMPLGKGRPRIPIKTHCLIHLLAQTFVCNGYRQTQRELNTHINWLRALKLEKSPDHTTMSKFRSIMGEGFFDEFFHQLTALLFKFEIIKKGDEVCIDSAPIEASQNFARSNAGITIDVERVKQFFSEVDYSPVLRLIAPEENCGRKRKYSDHSILKFISFQELGGFLSRNQAHTYVKKHPKVASVLGFKNGDIPSLPTINNYIKRMPPIPWLMKVMVDPITDFFDAQSDYDDSDPLSFFFRGL